MPNKVIRGNDTVRGTDAAFYIRIYDTETGKYNRYNFMNAKNIEATAEINKEDVPRIGTRVVGKKNGTITYSGSMTVYYMDSTLRNVYVNYVNNGIWPDIQGTLINYDKDSGAGANVAVLRGIKFDSIILAKTDVESTMLDEDLDFTFESIEYKDTFKSINEIEGESAPGEPIEYETYFPEG